MTDKPMASLLSLLVELQKYDTPEGWDVHTTPGWAPDPLQLSQISADRDFSPAVDGHLLITWGEKRFPAMFVLEATGGSPEHGHIQMRLFMMLTTDHEVVLSAAAGLGDDLTESMKTLFRVRPLDWWKRKALVQLGLVREDLPSSLSIDHEQGVQGPLVDFEEWMSGVLAPAATSQQRRNNRITPTLLREVADVYRTASADGRPPTVAVAEYFQISRANAAKWVARARQERVLGPALGTTAGEAPLGDGIGPVDYRSSDE